MYKLSMLGVVVAPLGDLLIVLPFATALVAWCWFSGDRRGAWSIAGAVLATLAAVAALKFVTNIGLEPWHSHWDGISNLFPSGHVAMATIVYGAAALCVGRAAPWLRWPTVIVIAVIVFAIGVERVVSGSHPPLDVLGGAAIGALALVSLRYLWPSGKLYAAGFLPVTIAGALIVVAFYGRELPTTLWVEQAVKLVRFSVTAIGVHL